MKSAAKLIANAAFGHCVQGRDHHVERFLVLGTGVIAQQEIIRDRPWKFRRAAEATVFHVEGAAEYREGGVESALGDGRSVGGRELSLLSQCFENAIAGMDNPLAILVPGRGDAMERIDEGGWR